MSKQLLLGEWDSELKFRELEKELRELKKRLIKSLKRELLYGDERSYCPDPREELEEFMSKVKKSDISHDKRKRLLSEAEDTAKHLERVCDLIEGIAYKLMHKEYEGDGQSPEFQEALNILQTV